MSLYEHLKLFYFQSMSSPGNINIYSLSNVSVTAIINNCSFSKCKLLIRNKKVKFKIPNHFAIEQKYKEVNGQIIS